MRERELENWGHLKSGGCHLKFLTQSKAYSFFMFFVILITCLFTLQKCFIPALVVVPQYLLYQFLSEAM